MTVGKLKAWLEHLDDDAEVMVETWDDKRCVSSGLKPWILGIDAVFEDNQIILYGKEVSHGKTQVH